MAIRTTSSGHESTTAPTDCEKNFKRCNELWKVILRLFSIYVENIKTRRLFRRRYFFGHLILSYIPAISLQLDQFYFSCFIFQFFFHRNFGELHRGNEPKNGWKFRLQFLTLMIKCIYQEALVNTCIKVLKF